MLLLLLIFNNSVSTYIKKALKVFKSKPKFRTYVYLLSLLSLLSKANLYIFFNFLISISFKIEEFLVFIISLNKISAGLYLSFTKIC